MHRRRAASVLTSFAAAILCIAAGPATSYGGLVINFTEDTDLQTLATTNAALHTQVVNGFQAAAQMWQNVLFDDVTVNVMINYKGLNPGVIGQAGSPQGSFAVSDVFTALANDRISSDDYTAVANLPSSPTLKFTSYDRTGNEVYDTGSSENNTRLAVNRANAKALGLIDAHDSGTDSFITFSSNYGFDFDRSNGIGSTLVDFVGAAAHEIGHALGFFSGVDDVDYYSNPNGPGRNDDLNGGLAGIGEFDDLSVFTVLDLFRNTTSAADGEFDWRYGGDPQFTIDGNNTYLANFSSGIFNGGDGRQASHWEDNMNFGIMDPTAANGELLVMKPLDIQAMDVIGWNLTAVPEPSSMVLATFAVAGGYAARRRRKGLTSIPS